MELQRNFVSSRRLLELMDLFTEIAFFLRKFVVLQNSGCFVVEQDVILVARSERERAEFDGHGVFHRPASQFCELIVYY